MAIRSRIISLPDENPVEDGRVVVRDELLPLPVVVREKDDRDRQSRRVHHLGELDDVHVLDVKRRDDEVEVCRRRRQVRLLRSPLVTWVISGGWLRLRTWNSCTDQLVEPAVFFEQVIVVEARNEEDVPDLEAHQLLEVLDAAPNRCPRSRGGRFCPWI